MWILLDHNQTDARYKIAEPQITQTLTSRMGTGGGHVPLVIQVDDCDAEKVFKSDDSRHRDLPDT